MESYSETYNLFALFYVTLVFGCTVTVLVFTDLTHVYGTYLLLGLISIPAIIMNIYNIQCSPSNPDCAYSWIKYIYYILYICLAVTICVIAIINLSNKTTTATITPVKTTVTTMTVDGTTTTDLSNEREKVSTVLLDPTPFQQNVIPDVKVGYVTGPSLIDNVPVVLPLYQKSLLKDSKFIYYIKYKNEKFYVTSNKVACKADFGCNEIFEGDTVTVPDYNKDEFIAHITIHS